MANNKYKGSKKPSSNGRVETKKPRALVPAAFNLYELINKSDFNAACLKLHDTDTPTDSALTDGHVEQIIDAYFAERGAVRTSGFDKDSVALALERSFKILAYLTKLWLHQNAVKATDIKGREVYDHLFRFFTKSQFRFGDTFGATSDYGTYIGISNNDWEKDYVVGLNYVYLNPELIQFIMRRYGTFHVSDYNGDNFYLVDIFPQGTDTNLPAILKAEITAMKALLAAYPELTNILNILGFKRSYAMGLDFKRDRTATSIFVTQNPDLSNIIINSHISPNIFGVDKTILWSSTNASRYYDMRSGNTIFQDMPQVQITSELLRDSYLLESDCKGFQHMYATSTGVLTSIMRFYIPNILVKLAPTLSQTPSAATYKTALDSYSNVVAKTTIGSFPVLPIEYELIFDYSSSDWYYVSSSVTNVLNDGSVYQLPDPNLIKQILRASLLYGGEYRRQLQNIISSLAQEEAISIY